MTVPETVKEDTPSIVVRDLVKRYGKVLAVDGISFEIKKGSITALLGGNGAGKTTTISMLLGALKPTSGSIHVLGHDMEKNRYPALQRMNFSSPYVDLPGALTVRQCLRVYGKLYNVPDVENAIDKLAEDLDLSEFIDRKVGRLSAGQKTRVSVAKALVNKPEVLLLDEPTASLDPDTADRIRGYLDGFRRDYGMTFLMASHNMREVERLCDNVLMMKRGKIVDQGTPQQLITRYGRADMEEVFLDIARGTGRSSEQGDEAQGAVRAKDPDGEQAA
ncbi:MAG: ATP-binding cassette domain-containing protein [Alphaproteobacteria bacterium]|nr:ATP-binding cassette domain-containing protein [Alphaproteobacteria bacterium]